MRARIGGPWIASFVVLTSLGFLGAACVTSDGGDEGDPLARLESLGAAWLETPATVTYSTMEHTAGSATSVHQCLRQLVETSVETAIRMCNPKGELTLTWDPPDRWRMKVTNARGVSLLVSTPEAAYHCHRSDTGPRRCAPTSAGELESDTPFGAIFLPPKQILDDLGPGAADSVATRSDREIAGTRTECFSATLARREGDPRRAGWCYSKDGVLLSSLVDIPEVGITTLEATDVSSRVSDTDFVVDADSTGVASIAGTWEFEALTGVPPAELPPGSVPDNRHDLVIDAGGSFRWGSWSGRVEAMGSDFALVVVRPQRLGQRFIDYGASAGITVVGDDMRIWLPDLGRDRDVDIGAAVEDIDSPDMAFRRAKG